MPQGSSLSPTLYTIYTYDIPPPAIDCLNIQYADDITQVISYAGKSRAMMANRTRREIEKINTYERKWKIKTNSTKFKIIPTALTKKHDIIINGTKIDYSENGNILVLTISRSGIIKHISETRNKGVHALTELRKFRNIPTGIKINLIKAYVLPILRYPIIPLVTSSKKSIKKLQTVQNQALRFAFNERFPYVKNTVTLHEESNIEPLNLHLANNQQPGNKKF